MSGYTHGMMTVRIPPDIAQQIHKNARDLNIDANWLILRLVTLLADKEFAEMWAEDFPGREQK